MALTETELAELAKKLADANKTLVDADKVRAEAEKVRADTAADRLLVQNKVDVAAADLETKRISNDKARADAEAARVDKLIEQVTGAVPDLGSLAKSTVSFAEGRALRQSEAISLALARVADEVGDDVVKALGTPTGGPAVLFVVADPKLVAALAGYWQIRHEATELERQLGEAQAAAVQALAPADREDGVEPEVAELAAPADAALVVAAVAGKAITEVASLFELDVAVTTGVTDIPATTVQASVIHRLLRPTPTKEPTFEVHHQWARLLSASSALLGLVDKLVALDIEVAQVDARLTARIAALGDPAADLAQATKDAADPKKHATKKAATDREDAARKNVALLGRLTEAQTDLTAVLQKVRGFSERITTVATAGQDSPLTAALSVEPLASEDGKHHVLVIGGGKAETYQVVVKRRIFAPRLEVSTAVEVDYFLVRGEQVVAAGHATAAASYQGKITGRGATWHKSPALDAR